MKIRWNLESRVKICFEICLKWKFRLRLVWHKNDFRPLTTTTINNNNNINGSHKECQIYFQVGTNSIWTSEINGWVGILVTYVFSTFVVSCHFFVPLPSAFLCSPMLFWPPAPSAFLRLLFVFLFTSFNISSS